MSFERDKCNTLEQPKLATDDAPSVLPLAIQEKPRTLDEKVRAAAKKIDEEKSIHYWYALFDASSSASSMYRYGGDLTHNSPDAMHDFLMTPTGMVIAAIETLFLGAFATFAAKYDKEKKNKFKKGLASAWPYLRDLIKALKNAYKGWRSTIFAFNLLLKMDLNYLVTPIGLILGMLAATHRLWLRAMVEARKKMMVFNLQLKKTINESPFTEEKVAYYLSQIKFQTIKTRVLAFLSAGSNGFIDGLYLYMGALALTGLTAPVFGALFVICVLYTIACVVNRIFEEYEYQTRLMLTQTKCILTIISQRIKATFAQILVLQEGLKDKFSLAATTQLRQLKAKLLKLLSELEQNRLLQKKQSNRTGLTSVLFGLKNALYAYNALSSILFFSAALLLLCGVACISPLFIIFMALGLLSTFFFIGHAIYIHQVNKKKQALSGPRPADQLCDLQKSLALQEELLFHDEASFYQALEDALEESLLAQFLFQEWFEIIRSWFSGFGKGQKLISFAGNAFQELDAQGHYQDTFFLRLIGLGTGFVVSTVFGLRAFAKGLGRAPLGQEKRLAKEKTEAQTVNAENKNSNSLALNEEIQPETLIKPALKPDAANHYGRFFTVIQNKATKQALMGDLEAQEGAALLAL